MFRLLKKIVGRAIAFFFASTVIAVIAVRWVPVCYTPLMFLRLTQQDHPRLVHRWVSLDHMSPSLPRAVMASEDQRFAQHHGFDFKAIEAAAKRNREHPEKNRLGASTITQQTAKNVFLWPGRSWLRKGLEAWFTVLIELFWTKERIMEVYLNSIETGDGIYGAEAVAREHFGCSASQLTAEQCALIAATLPNPRRYSSAAPTPYMKKRQAQILRQMRNVEWPPSTAQK